MSQVNVWFGIPEDDHNELNNRRGTADNVGPAKSIVDGQFDPEVVQNLFSTRTQGQTTFHLWCVLLDERNGPIQDQVDAFRQEFPGCRVEGAWVGSGAPYGMEVVYTEVDNPNYDPRETLGEDQDADPPIPGVQNPDYDPNLTITQKTLTGSRIYPQGNDLLDYMNGASELVDIHLPVGWEPRIFT